MNYQLNGKVALVAGSSQGIGKATAIAMAQSGADVILCARSLDKLESTAKEIEALGRKALAIQMDITKLDQIERAVAQGVEAFGHIDILVSSAGVSIACPIVEMDEKLWDMMYDTNVKGVAFLTKAVAKQMIEKNIKGRILYIASQAGKMGEYGNTAYCSSKAALTMMTQCVALELAEHGINVVSICPGTINTSMMQDVINDRAPLNGMTNAEFEQSIINNIPLGRMGKPEEVAAFLCFLASDDAAFFTGVSLTIAGGQTNI